MARTNTQRELKRRSWSLQATSISTGQPVRLSGGMSNTERRKQPSPASPTTRPPPARGNSASCPICKGNPGQTDCTYCAQRSANRPPPGSGNARSPSPNGKPAASKEAASPRPRPTARERPASGKPAEKRPAAAPAAASSKPLPAPPPTPAESQPSKCCESCATEIRRKKPKKQAEPFCTQCSGNELIPPQPSADDSPSSSSRAAGAAAAPPMCSCPPRDPNPKSSKEPPPSPATDRRREEETQAPIKCKKCRRKELDVHGYLPCSRRYPKCSGAAAKPFDPNDAKTDYAEYRSRSGRFIRNPLTVSACSCHMQPRGRPPKFKKVPPPPFCTAAPDPAGSPKCSNHHNGRLSSGFGLPPLNNNYNFSNFVPQTYFSERQGNVERNVRSASKDRSSYAGTSKRRGPLAGQQRAKRPGMKKRRQTESRSHLTRPRFSVPNRRLSGSGIRCPRHGPYLSRPLTSKLPRALTLGTLRGAPKTQSVKRRSCERPRRAKLEEEGRRLRQTKARCPAAGAPKVRSGARSGLEPLRHPASSRGPSVTRPSPVRKALPAPARLQTGRVDEAAGAAPQVEREMHLLDLADTSARFYHGGFLSIRPQFPLASISSADADALSEMMQRIPSRASSFIVPNRWHMNGLVGARPSLGTPTASRAAGRLLRKLCPNWLINGKARPTRP